MVTRAPWLLLPLLLAGCPDDIGRTSGPAGATGLLAPAGLQVDYDGGSRIHLRWSDRSTTESGFRLEMSSTPFDAPTLADVRFLPAESTSMVYPTTPNTTYYFRLFAITPATESDPSNVAVATTPDVPVQPTGVDARPHTSTEIAMSWNDVGNETSYAIERSVDGGTTWIPAGSAPTDATSTVIGGLSPDTEYLHRIVAMKGIGRSTPSDPAVAQTTTASMAFTMLSAVGNYGLFTSCAVEPGGREHIAHYDAVNSSVLYSTRLLPGAFVTVTADGGPSGFEEVGSDGTGIAVDFGGKVHIVAHDRTSDTLRYATNSSGTWKATALDTSSGAQPRIGYTRQGFIHATYLESYGGLNGTLVRFASNQDGGWKTYGGTARSVPAARYGLGFHDAKDPVLACVDAAGLIQFYSGHWTGGIFPGSPPKMTWDGPVPLPPAGDSPQVDAAAVGEDDQGLPRVVFHDRSTGSLDEAHWNGMSMEVATIDSQQGLDVGAFCGLFIEASIGRLHVVYFDATRKDLRYARKDPGGPWVRRVIDAVGDVGSHASIAVDGTGRVTIAYRDETNRRLRVAVGRP